MTSFSNWDFINSGIMQTQNDTFVRQWSEIIEKCIDLCQMR